MHSIKFQCPSCSARLRLRDRNQLRRKIPCPDCGEPLKLSPDGPHRVVVSRISNAAKDAAPGRAAAPTSVIRAKLSEPRIASLLVATLILVGLVVILWTSSGTTAESPGDAVAADETQPVPEDQSATGQEVADETPAPEVEPNTNDSAKVDDAKSKTTERIASADNSTNATSKAGTTEVRPPIEETPDASNASSGTIESETTPIVEPDLNPIEPDRKHTEQKPEPPPADPVESDEERAARVQRKLDQKILAYEQPQPVKLTHLLLEWEELSGVAVEFADDVPAATRQLPVSVKLKNTTVRQILDALLNEAQLTSRSEADKILIVQP